MNDCYFNPLQTAAMESCPKLLPPENNDDYIIHVNYTYGEIPLVIRAENLEEFSDSFSSNKFKCVIKSGGEELFRTNAVLNADNNVECVKNRVSWRERRGVQTV